MRKLDWPTIGIAFLWLIVGIWMLIYNKAEAQDNLEVTSCYTRTDVGAVFTFSNIPDNWLNEAGWYFIGDDVQLDGHTLIVTGLQFDEGYSYAIVGANDYSASYTASTDLTPLCDAPIEPTTTPEPVPPVVQQVVSQAVVSSGKTCTIKYPEIILVCNG